MNETRDGKESRKGMLKALREARKQSIEVLSRKMKEQRKIIEALKLQLRDGPKTVPEIALALGMPSSEIMWYVAALKKYGEIAEGEKDESYFRYELLSGGGAEVGSDPI